MLSQTPSAFAALNEADARADDALAVQDELGFAYCSDVRGTGPSLPRVFLPSLDRKSVV